MNKPLTVSELEIRRLEEYLYVHIPFSEFMIRYKISRMNRNELNLISSEIIDVLENHHIFIDDLIIIDKKDDNYLNNTSFERAVESLESCRDSIKNILDGLNFYSLFDIKKCTVKKLEKLKLCGKSFGEYVASRDLGLKRKLANKRYLSYLMDVDLFTKCYKAGKVLGLSHKQAQFFAGTALEFDSEEIANLTETKSNSLGALKREVMKKLGIQNELPNQRNKFLKDIADRLISSDVYESVEVAHDGSAADKIKQLDRIAENKQLADMIRANPEFLQMLQQMNQNQQG